MGKPKSNKKSRSESASTKKHGKLSLLRKKLKLKHQDHAQEDPVDEGNIRKKPPAAHQARKKLFQRGSPMKLVRLYPNMTHDQMSLVRKAEFSGMLDIKCCKLEPELCMFLMGCFNPATCEMVFPGRGSIPVTEDSVYKVQGVPWGDKDVRYEIDADAIKFMAKQFGHTGKNQPTMTTLEDKLIEMDNADSTYLRCWSAFCMCSVLAPTTGIHVSPRIYPSLVNIKEVNKLNVPKFVIKMLRKAAKSRPEKAVQKACMPYMMVMYVDSLELNNMDVCKHGTRVRVWTNSMVKQAIIQDSFEDGSFGRASLKEEFRIQDTQLNSTEDVSDNERTEDHTESKETVDQSGSEEDEVEAVKKDIEVKNDSEQDEVEAFKKDTEGKNDSEEDEVEAVKKDTEGKNDSEEDEVEPVKKDTEGKNDSEENEVEADTEETNCRRGNNEMTNGGDGRQSTLFPDKGVFASFLATNASADCSSDEKANLAKAIEDSCYDFEASLQKMIQTITRKSDAASYITKRMHRQPVAKKKKSKNSCTEDEQTPAPTSDKSESVRATDTDYFPDEDEHERTESYLSLEDESYDIKGSSEAKEQSNHDLRTRKRKRIIRQLDPETRPSDATPPTCSGKNTFQDTPFEATTLSSPATSTSPLQSEKIDKDFTESTTYRQMRSKEGQGNHQIPEANAVEYKYKVVLDLNKPTIDMTDGKMGHEECKDTDVTNTDDLSQMKTEIPLASKPEANITREEVFQHEPVHECKVPEFPCSKPAANQIGNKNASQTESFGVADILTALGETYKSASNSNNQDSISEDTTLDSTDVYAEGHHKMNLHDCVAYSPPKKFEVPHFETPAMLDLEMYRTTSYIFQGIVKSMGEMEQNNEGLQRYLNGSPSKELKNILSEMEPNTKSSKRKSMTFADGTNPNQQHVSGYMTRSSTRATMAESRIRPSSKLRRQSPRRAITQDSTDGTEDRPIDLTEQRVTRSSVKSARRNAGTEKTLDEQNVEVGLPNQTTLGFDTQQEQIEEIKENGNEENVPTTLQPVCVEYVAGPSGASITLVPNEYQKRIIKPGKFDRSPYLPDNKKYLNVSRAANELYNMVIKHGWDSGSKDKKEPIIDVSTYFVILADLADSVAPGKQLVNFIADVAIHIIDAENKNKKKFIMPLRITTYLLDCRFKLKDVRRFFCASTTHRLDHKELICFPTLLSFDHQPKFDKDSGIIGWSIST